MLLLILSGAYEAQGQGLPPLVPPSAGFGIFGQPCPTTGCELPVGSSFLINVFYFPGIPDPNDTDGARFRNASLVVEGDLGNISNSAFLNHCQTFIFGDPMPFLQTSYSTPGPKTIT
ncbi:MAG: hypothetical protein ACRD5W_00465, partial [Candidatus Acidiferrales bacterium]